MTSNAASKKSLNYKEG